MAFYLNRCKSAIHDKGFQFYLTLDVDSKIDDLLKDIHILEECIQSHKEYKSEEWYNSKTKLGILSDIEGYKAFSRLTSKECTRLYNETKQKYDLLISMCESALMKAVENTKKEMLSGETGSYFRAYSEDPERKYVIVDKLEDD